MADLLLIPGLMCDRAVWAPQIAALGKYVKCQVADPTAASDMVELAELVLNSAPPRFALAGFSMGGYLALEIALRVPERIERLALIDTKAKADTKEERERRFEFISLAEEGQFLELAERFLTLLVHPDRLTDERLCRTLRQMILRVGPEAMVRQERALLSRQDRSDSLEAIEVETLVLCGRQDVLTPLARSEELATCVPRADLVVVEDCGHTSTLERPEAVNQALFGLLGIPRSSEQ